MTNKVMTVDELVKKLVAEIKPQVEPELAEVDSLEAAIADREVQARGLESRIAEMEGNAGKLKAEIGAALARGEDPLVVSRQVDQAERDVAVLKNLLEEVAVPKDAPIRNQLKKAREALRRAIIRANNTVHEEVLAKFEAELSTAVQIHENWNQAGGEVFKHFGANAMGYSLAGGNLHSREPNVVSYLEKNLNWQISSGAARRAREAQA